MVTILRVEEVAERFLDEEAATPLPGVDANERARFHRLVRQCAANWLLHPKAGLRITRGKSALTLHFEGPFGGKLVSVFALRVGYDTKDFRFVGPNADRKKLGLPPPSVLSLDRLRDLYEALLSERVGSGDPVTAIMRGDRLPDLVPLVEETRRALDGGQETSPPITTFPITVKKKAAAHGAAIPTSPLTVPIKVAVPSPSFRAAAPASRTSPMSPAPKAPPPRVAEPAPVPAVARPAPKPAAMTPTKSTSASPPRVPPSPAKPAVTAAPARPATVAVPSSPPAPKVAPAAPTLGYVMLACPDPKKSAEFLAKVLDRPASRRTKDGTYFELDLGGFILSLQEDLSKAERSAYGIGSVEKHRGWGVLFQVRVPDFDGCLKRAKRLKDAIVRDVGEAKSFVLRDPAGFLFEILPA